ncbi:MAG: histidine kinase [Actinobacteria bacterium]|nr:histidine kinase [Actinomycetota bacterium]
MASSPPPGLVPPLVEAIGEFPALVIAVLDDELRLRWASPSVLARRGATLDRAVGAPIDVLLPAGPPTPAFKALLRSGLDRTSHAVLPFADGRDRDLMVFPVDLDGQRCVGLVGVLITAAMHRTLDEHELRETLLADAAQLGVWRLDLSDGSLQGNSWYRVVNDVGTPDVPRHRSDVAARMHPDDVRRVTGTVDRAVETGEPYTMKYRLVGPNGESKTLQSRGSVVPGKPDQVIGVVMDVTASEAAAEREAELRQLAATASDTERDRIAADLHDGPLQVLSAAWMKLGSLERSMGQGPEAEERRADVRAVAKLLSDANTELRDLLGRLTTLPVGASTDAFRDELADLAERVAERSDLEVRVVCEFERDLALADTVLSSMYRIIGEALSNAERHARATSVSVAVELFDGALVAAVVDDGRGFDTAAPPPAGHFGLSVMRQRAAAGRGSVAVSSVVGGGTIVMVRLPLDPDREPIRD